MEKGRSHVVCLRDLVQTDDLNGFHVDHGAGIAIGVAFTRYEGTPMDRPAPPYQSAPANTDGGNELGERNGKQVFAGTLEAVTRGENCNARCLGLSPSRRKATRIPRPSNGSMINSHTHN